MGVNFVGGDVLAVHQRLAVPDDVQGGDADVVFFNELRGQVTGAVSGYSNIHNQQIPFCILLNLVNWRRKYCITRILSWQSPFCNGKWRFWSVSCTSAAGRSGGWTVGAKKKRYMACHVPLWGIRGQSIVGRSSPRKNTATVPGPLWEPMMVPMSHRRILPFRWGKRSSSAVMSRAASSGHREWQTKQRWS